MPLPAVWGPVAWRLLHAIGARAGSCKTIKLKQDEIRECFWLLSHLEYIIPCPECRSHILDYRKKHGLPEDITSVGAWLWTFHEAVNERLGKPEGPPFTHDLGRQTNPTEVWKLYQEIIKESYLNGNLIGKDVKEWGRHLKLWLACL
jgi:hypothetical protein